MSKRFTPIGSFIHELGEDSIPPEVMHQARRCLLDLLGVWAAGSETTASRIARDHAVRRYGVTSDAVTMPFDGRRVSPAGAVFAGATTIDAIDGHDGHEVCKGHAGAALLPVLIASLGDTPDCDTVEVLTALVVGYEIGLRAGLALHATAKDYHSSGAWNSLGCAAIGARLRRLDRSQTCHALGIAEYYGPRAPMMRCIDHPSMVKDSSGWGALVGATAVDLAQDGFTGAPALLCELDDATEFWSDIGVNWRMREMNFKAYPVCRWAQPAIEAALALIREHKIEPSQINDVQVTTFHEATRLAVSRPADTEEAQYSLPFPLALSILVGSINPSDLLGSRLRDPAILAMADRVRIVEKPEYNAAFPNERFADVRFTMYDGTALQSRPTVARGNYDAPLTDEELVSKFRDYVIAHLEEHDAEWIVRAIMNSGGALDVEKLISIINGRSNRTRQPWSVTSGPQADN